MLTASAAPTALALAYSLTHRMKSESAVSDCVTRDLCVLDCCSSPYAARAQAVPVPQT